MSEADGYSGELRDIAYHVECLAAAVERIEKALVSQGSEREHIALRIYSANTIGADTAFEYADEWIAERDKQRAQQAEQGRAE